jgi:hypothetical protein
LEKPVKARFFHQNQGSCSKNGSFGTASVVNKINAAPMECFGFKTPAGGFAECGGVVLAG